MQISSSIRREVARIVQQEAMANEIASRLPLSGLQEILGAILSRQSVTRQGLQSLDYPPEIIRQLESVMEHFDALNFWSWLGVRGQTLLSLADYLQEVNGFVEMVQPHLEQYPQLTHFCLKLTSECDTLAGQVLRDFYPIPEMHVLLGNAERVRQVIQTVAV